jgi:hypothetical protein
MRKIIIASVVILASSYSVASFAKDPCKTLACMAAKSGGEFGSIGDSDCSGAIADFFNIVKKTSMAFFLITQQMRVKNFLWNAQARSRIPPLLAGLFQCLDVSGKVKYEN